MAEEGVEVEVGGEARRWTAVRWATDGTGRFP
jgi:hypothetical protein